MPDKLIADITDHELITELKIGTQKSYEILFYKYSPIILSILDILKVEDHRSEQVLVQSFMRIKNEIHSFDLSKSRLYTWVIKIARETIKELCMKELEQFKIQNLQKYVNTHSTSKTPLLDHVMAIGSYEVLAELIGVTRDELMIMVKTEVNQMKISKG